MENIELFYQVKNLFNTSEKAFDIYRNLKMYSASGYGEIVYLCSSSKDAEYYFNRTINENKELKSTSRIDYRNRVIDTEKEKVRFASLENFIKNKDGIRIKAFRFLM